MKENRLFSVPLFSSFVIMSCLFFDSCKREENMDKLPAESCYIFSDGGTQMVNSFYLCDGEAGFFEHINSPIDMDSFNQALTQASHWRTGLNLANGKYFREGPFFNTSYERTIQSNRIIQLADNRNLFALIKDLDLWNDSVDVSYSELYLTDKNLKNKRKVHLYDTSENIQKIGMAANGRLILLTSIDKVKRIECYNSDLELEWQKVAEQGTNSSIYENRVALTTSDYIYVLQSYPGIYTEKSYRVFQYDYAGNRISKFERNNALNKYSASDIYESPSGYFIVGTRYVPEKSTFDINVSGISSSNTLMGEHVLNILDFMPGWNLNQKTVYEVWNSDARSNLIKTADGYCFSIAYLDNKNSLALVKLTEDMKIKSVQTVAQHVEEYFPTSRISLKKDDRQIILIWNLGDRNYFYVLDKNGNFIVE